MRRRRARWENVWLLAIGAGLLLAFPEMTSNLYGLGVMLAAAAIGKLSVGKRAAGVA